MSCFVSDNAIVDELENRLAEAVTAHEATSAKMLAADCMIVSLQRDNDILRRRQQQTDENNSSLRQQVCHPHWRRYLLEEGRMAARSRRRRRRGEGNGVSPSPAD